MANQAGRRPARDPQRIQEEIERARTEITTSVLALRERVSAATDWRVWVRRQPLMPLGAAFAVGFWLGFRRTPA
jgi:ElaB/YqjD/DUF883 family membrane-anchored ribosome-binding protein